MKTLRIAGFVGKSKKLDGGGYGYNEYVVLINIEKENIMRIILDTDKKTITVPWNYADKLAAMNKIIEEAGGTNAKKLDFKNYINEIWQYAMDNSDECLRTAQKPARKDSRTNTTVGVNVVNTVAEEKK